MNAHQLLKAIADDADATGCDDCYVVSAEHIRAALEFVREHPEPQTPRILVHIDSGAIHNIASTVPGVEVLIKDDDVEGADPETIRTDSRGERFSATLGPWEVNPALVEGYFEAAADAGHPARVAATPRVVIVLEGGVCQNILVDAGGTVEVLVKDYWVADEDRHTVPLDSNGVPLYAIEGPMQVGAKIVEECYRSVADFEERQDPTA